MISFLKIQCIFPCHYLLIPPENEPPTWPLSYTPPHLKSELYIFNNQNIFSPMTNAPLPCLREQKDSYFPKKSVIRLLDSCASLSAGATHTSSDRSRAARPRVGVSEIFDRHDSRSKLLEASSCSKPITKSPVCIAELLSRVTRSMHRVGGLE